MTRERSGVLTRLARAALAAPEPLLDRVIGAPSVVIDGRVLDRRVQMLLVAARRLGLDSDVRDVAHRRRRLTRSARIGMPARQGIHVADRRIPGPGGEIALRIYRRLGGPLEPATIVYFHGGGWVTGDLDSHDGSCRLLADVTGCVVVAVDYRLAPEHPFPAAVEDCLAAYRWTCHHSGDLAVAPGRVGVMGDSAGGNLAAVVALQTRHADVPAPVAQGLVYPATDFRMDSVSHRLFAEGFWLERADMEWMRSLYLPDPGRWTDPLASPLLEPDVTGAAPALVVTAGFDPLRDEGMAYARRLRESGVPVHARCYDDLVHAFFGMGVLPGGMAIATEICAAMGDLMGGRA